MSSLKILSMFTFSCDNYRDNEWTKPLILNTREDRLHYTTIISNEWIPFTIQGLGSI